MEIARSEKSKRYVSMFVFIVLIFTLFFGNTVQTNAIPVAVPFAGESALGGILSAYGFEDMTASQVEACWDDLPSAVQAALIEAGQNATLYSEDYGLAKISLTNLTSGEWQLLNNWFMEKFGDISGQVKLCQVVPSDLTNFKGVPLYDDKNVMIRDWYNTQNPPKILYKDPRSGTEYDKTVYAIMAPDLSVRFDLTTNRISLWSASGSATQAYMSNNQVNLRQNMSYDGTYKLVDFDGTIQIVDSKWKPIGYMSSGITVDYSRVTGYGPDQNPLPVGLTSSVIVPAVTDPVGVPQLPDNSVDPIPLSTLVAGLNALDGFFDQGNSIILADGTVIGKLPDLARAENPPMQDVSSGTMEGDVKGIRNAINSVLDWLSSLYALLAKSLDLSLEGILNAPLQTMLDRINIDAFQQSFQAFDNMQKGYGEPPKIYINLHKLAATAQNVGSFNNQFVDQDSLLIDFAKLEEIQFMGMTLIQMIRSMMSLAMITITVFYIHRKLEPQTII